VQLVREKIIKLLSLLSLSKEMTCHFKTYHFKMFFKDLKDLKDSKNVSLVVQLSLN